MLKPFPRPENVYPTSLLKLRKLLDGGGKLNMNPVKVDGRTVWQVDVTMPDDPMIYRLVSTNTLEERHFKSIATLYKFYTELFPDAEQFCVGTKVVEEISTE